LSTWTDEDLARLKSEMGMLDDPILGSLESPRNFCEGQKIAAGQQLGAESIWAFESVFENPRYTSGLRSDKLAQAT
jgi:hypothetical protein